MTDTEKLNPPFRWIGMGYRLNGDGFGRIKNDLSGQTFRIGACEVGHPTGRHTNKHVSELSMAGWRV